jgi:hypothetical protein
LHKLPLANGDIQCSLTLQTAAYETEIITNEIDKNKKIVKINKSGAGKASPKAAFTRTYECMHIINIFVIIKREKFNKGT